MTNPLCWICGYEIRPDQSIDYADTEGREPIHYHPSDCEVV